VIEWQGLVVRTLGDWNAACGVTLQVKLVQTRSKPAIDATDTITLRPDCTNTSQALLGDHLRAGSQ
jgi:hypothetical protein